MRRIEVHQSKAQQILTHYEQWLQDIIDLVDPDKYAGTSVMERTRIHHERHALLKAQVALEATIKHYQGEQ